MEQKYTMYIFSFFLFLHCVRGSLFSYYYSHPLSPHGCTEPRPAGVVKGVFAERECARSSHAMSSSCLAMRREKTFCYIAKVPLLRGRQVQKDIRPRSPTRPPLCLDAIWPCFRSQPASQCESEAHFNFIIDNTWKEKHTHYIRPSKQQHSHNKPLLRNK